MLNHFKGLLITILGVVILSPDALLVRLANTNSWTILFWRGLFFALGITLVIFLTYREKIFQQFWRIGRRGVLLGVLFGFSTIFFVTGLRYTSIANVLVIISTSPVFAALLSRVVLKEKTLARTWITMFIIIAAMLLIMMDSFKSGGFWGDISALMVSILIATTFTIARQAKNINMVPAMAIGGLVTSGVSFIAISTSASIPLYLETNAVPYLLTMGFVTTLAFSLIMIGPRYLPAAEVSMIMPLETVFGTLLGIIYLNEMPSNYAIIGGIIILVTLSIHSWLSLKK